MMVLLPTPTGQRRDAERCNTHNSRQQDRSGLFNRFMVKTK